MKVVEIREKFLNFFKERDHRVYDSFSLVPDDKSILFTIAGMIPFKRIFLGIDKPNTNRATSSQRCIRTGDIEIIGLTPRHLTSFEMLGNFSFGDYFKKEAISYGWELITEEFKIPKNKLIVTVYKEDEEAYDIWSKIIDKDQIVRLDKDNNFWTSGESGPCGPSSEIYYAFDGLNDFDPESERFIEIYNMVFMELNRENGKYSDLPNKNIDTGMGLERLAYVLQDVDSVFDIDSVRPIVDKIKSLAKEKDIVSERVLADHVRSAALLIGDGIRPSNEKRGYVLRKLLRIALRYMKKLNMNCSLTFLVDEVLIQYPHLKDCRSNILENIEMEEKKFGDVLKRGLVYFNEYIRENIEKVIDADFVFKLFDTYGFPFELTKEIALENGREVSEKDFNIKFANHRNVSKNSLAFKGEDISEEYIHKISKQHGESKFLGYEELTSKSTLIDFFVKDNLIEMIFTATPFYAESGGQIGDIGRVFNANFEGKVVNVQKKLGIYIHYVEPIKGKVSLGDYILEVDSTFRKAISINHTATHLLHAASKIILGQASQAGSLVTDKRVRLDLKVDKTVTDKDVKSIELLVNQKIEKNLSLKTEVEDLDKAVASGALANFGDRYGDIVRVVSISKFSKELCGGTHAKSSSDLRIFKIISFKKIAAETYRVEAITGNEAIKHMNSNIKLIDELAKKLNSLPKDIIDRTEKLIADSKKLKKDMDVLNVSMLNSQLKNAKSRTINNIEVIDIRVDLNKPEKIPNLDDAIIYDKFIAMITFKDDFLVIKISKNLTDILHVGDKIRDMLESIGRKGGGSKELAQIKLNSKTDMALLKDMLKKEVSIL